MNKETLSLILLSTLLVAGYVPIAFAHNAPFPAGYDPTHVVVDTISEPETVDPAWRYDTASSEIILNVYETLLFDDNIMTDAPYAAGKLDVFKPQLATDVAVAVGPAPYSKTVYFRVRGQAEGVDTFVTTASPVDLFKDGQIYGGKLFVRDPNYGQFGKIIGKIESPNIQPLDNDNVTRANVPGLTYSSDIRVQLNKTFGGIRTDRAYSVVQTSDGGYAIAGETYSYGVGTPIYPNAYLVKIDALGNLEWERTYADVGSDSVHCLVQTSDGGYALAGFTDSYGAGGADFWLVKTDADGNHLWNKTYGGPRSDYAYSLVQTSDGGYALAGFSNSFGATGADFWLVKTDADGNHLWDMTYGGIGSDYAYSLVQTSDDGYALLGYTDSIGAGSYDFWLVKTDVDGNPSWDRPYGGTGADYGSSLVQTSDGGYAMAGSTYSYGNGGADFWLVKTDADGNPSWDETYGGTNGDFAFSLVQTRDDGFALAGYTASYGAGTDDFWLVKTEFDGVEQWDKTFGGASNDDAFSLIQTSDREYALAGITYSYGLPLGNGDFWFIKTYTTLSQPTDTTWRQRTAGNRGQVIRGWDDANNNEFIDAGDIIRFVRKEENVAGAMMARWNVAEYYLVTGVTSIFPYTITATRQPVRFHDGQTLSTADVAYSFWRWVVQDRDGGSQWMFYYPVFNKYFAADPADDPNFGLSIAQHIESNATHVMIHLDNDFPMTTFLQIMSQPGASIVEKTWAEGLGDLNIASVPGGWSNWQTIYDTWHNPSTSFVEDQMMGTGPFMFNYWVHGTAWSFVKNPNYWDGTPALVSPTGTQRLPSMPDMVTENLLTNWVVRRERFLAGDSDYTYVPRQFIGGVLGTVVGGESVRCYYPIEPVLALDAFFFNFDINPTSPYLGPGFNPTAPLTISEDRIPTNLFSDINVRRGFRFAFDYATYLANAYLGEATQPADPVIQGLPYDNPVNALPFFNMFNAQVELQAAFGGSLWANGMTMVLPFNSGNLARERAVTIMMNNINALNPKFHLSILEVPWGSTYLPSMVARMLPAFSNSWTADYPDPDDFVFPFMHSQGTFSKFQSYSNARVDALIKAGALTPDDVAPYAGQLDQPDLASLIAVFNNYPNIPPDNRWPRRSIYYELQAIYTEDVPGVCLAQPVGRHWEQAWMRGWYYNPLYGGSLASGIESTAPEAPVTYFYHIWKAVTHFGDANNDGIVNVVDGAVVAASWTKPSPTSPVGPLGYKTQADLTGGSGGIVGFGSGLVVGIPDGKVSVADAALVSSYWDGPPKGPTHP